MRKKDFRQSYYHSAIEIQIGGTMEIRGNIKDNNLIIEVIGRLSGDYANRAEQLIRELSVGGDYEWTIFDLKGLEYISSAGLRVIMRIYRKDKKLRIVNASPAGAV
jgi:anti-anti-sigma factor